MGPVKIQSYPDILDFHSSKVIDMLIFQSKFVIFMSTTCPKILIWTGIKLLKINI